MSIYEKIISRRLIDKGWSGDRKYRAACDDGGVYLLRVASGERAARFPFVFERMKAAGGARAILRGAAKITGGDAK
jgi:hypothetical protein